MIRLLLLAVLALSTGAHAETNEAVTWTPSPGALTDLRVNPLPGWNLGVLRGYTWTPAVAGGFAGTMTWFNAVRTSAALKIPLDEAETLHYTLLLTLGGAAISRLIAYTLATGLAKGVSTTLRSGPLTGKSGNVHASKRSGRKAVSNGPLSPGSFDDATTKLLELDPAARQALFDTTPGIPRELLPKLSADPSYAGLRHQALASGVENEYAALKNSFFPGAAGFIAGGATAGVSIGGMFQQALAAGGVRTTSSEAITAMLGVGVFFGASYAWLGTKMLAEWVRHAAVATHIRDLLRKNGALFGEGPYRAAGEARHFKPSNLRIRCGRALARIGYGRK